MFGAGLSGIDGVGLFLDRDGTDFLIALDGEPAPTTFGRYSFPGAGPPAINASGEVAFQSEITDGSTIVGIFVWSGFSGEVRAVALEGESAGQLGDSYYLYHPNFGPNFPDMKLNPFGVHQTINSAGTVSFLSRYTLPEAEVEGDDSVETWGIFYEASGIDSRLPIDWTTPDWFPEADPVTFDPPHSQNDSGNFALRAYGGLSFSQYSYGVFFFEAFSREVFRVARFPGTEDGTDDNDFFRVSELAMNNLNQIAFAGITLEPRSQYLFLAYPLPTLSCPAKFTIRTRSTSGVSSEFVSADRVGVLALYSQDPVPTIEHNAPDVLPLDSTVVTYTLEESLGSTSCDVLVILEPPSRRSWTKYSCAKKPPIRMSRRPAGRAAFEWPDPQADPGAT